MRVLITTAGGIISSNGSAKNYPGKLTFRVFITCLTATFGGLIFGYDLGNSGTYTTFLFYIFCIIL